MKKVFLFLFLTLATQGFAQTDPFKEFEEFKKQTEEGFNKFKDSIYQDFENFKKVTWKKFTFFKTGGRFQNPKPVVFPQAKPNEIPTKPTPLITTTPTIEVLPDIKLPEDDFSKKRSSNFKRKLIELSKTTKNQVKINFYNTSFNLFYDDIDFTINEISNKSITNAVQQLFAKNKTLEQIIFQCINYISLMKLNDYGLVQILRKTAQKIYNDKQKATLFTWFVLNKMKYNCKIGYAQNGHLFLLIPSNVKFLNTFNIRQGGKNYYVVNFNNKDLYTMRTKGVKTYLKNPFNTKYNLNFLFKHAPKINSQQAFTTRKIMYPPYKISLPYNISYVNFLKELPVLDYPAYFHIPMSKNTEKQLEEKINPLLYGKTTPQKVNILLNLVQHGFDYKYDKDNFGRGERPQAPEEMLYYKYSDCEDHSALFAYLVNHFTTCKVVGVLYNSHATTAVKFPNHRPNGYYLPKPYNDYLICDATYIGASIGQSMPKFIGIVPEAVFNVKKHNK